MAQTDVPKVVAALRQASANHQMLVKLLQRVEMSNDDVVLKEITRMHGFSLMYTVLNEFLEDEEIVSLVGVNVLVDKSRSLIV